MLLRKELSQMRKKGETKRLRREKHALKKVGEDKHAVKLR